MKTVELLNDITYKMVGRKIEVNKIMMSSNLIELDGIVYITNVTENLDYDYDYQVDTRDATEGYKHVKDAIAHVLRELEEIGKFKSGATVKHDGKRFMLVPDNRVKGDFYLLNLSTHKVTEFPVSKTYLYKNDYYLVED